MSSLLQPTLVTPFLCHYAKEWRTVESTLKL